MKKWILRLIIIVLLTPVLLIAWYSISFLPHLNEINRLVENGNEKIKPIFQTFYPLAVAGETKERIRGYALRRAYWYLAHRKEKKGMDSWHLNNILWNFASHIHLTDKEVFGLWVNCSLFECDKGLSKASLMYHKKILSKLSLQEQAGLVALVRSPSRYKVGSKKSKIRIKEIIEKAENHNPTNNSESSPNVDF